MSTSTTSPAGDTAANPLSLGFCLPTFGKPANEPGGVARFAVEAEKLGVHSLWVGDRLLTPVEPEVGYSPGSTDIPVQFRSALDPLVALAVAAGVTSTPRLGSSAIMAPWYPPALLARALASIDVASGGRLITGFGIGWSPEEYQAAGVPFARRGDRLDELLDVLEAWWTADPVAHSGPLLTIPPSYVETKPVQQPRPPVYLAAFSGPALRRIGERADGWLPVWWAPEAFPASVIADSWDAIRSAAEAVGRDPQRIDKILRINVATGTSTRVVADEVRRITELVEPSQTLIDFTFVAESVDHTVDLTGHVLELVAAG